LQSGSSALGEKEGLGLRSWVPSFSPTRVVSKDLTDRLRRAAELVGVLARDHVIVAAGGYYSLVEAGRWRR
jgi:DNA repair protein RadC